MKKFIDVEIGDICIVQDEYGHDYTTHNVKVNCIEHDKEYITETNPMGKICYGDDIEADDYGDEYITHVSETNFICIKG